MSKALAFTLRGWRCVLQLLAVSALIVAVLAGCPR